MHSYQQLLKDVLENGEQHDDRTGVGTRSVFGRQWRHDMREGFPLLTTKKVPLRWVFEELRWFLSGSTSVRDLQAAGVDIWDEWATVEQCGKFGRPPGELGPIYGALWRNFGDDYRLNKDPHFQRGTDQIAQLLTDIEQSPNSRRLIVSGWHPVSARQVALPPCHTLWQMKIHHNGGISLHLYARSIDIFLGLPFNIASYALLLTMIGTVTAHQPRELIISFGDLHLYNNHADQATVQLSRSPYPLPSLKIEEAFIPETATSLDRLLNITWENVLLESYQHHPKIEAEVAV